MKTLLAATARIGLITAALITAAGVASAQMIQTMPTPRTATPSWTADDGSSSDHPIHNPGDISGDRLNAQYNGGITVPPGQGFPGYPGQR